LKFLLTLLIFTSLLYSSEKIILGQAPWAFEFLPQAIALPQGHHPNVQDYHGVAVDSKGRVYIGYYSKKSTKETRAVARFSYHPDSDQPFRFDRFLGDSTWNDHRLHGLNIINLANGEERLLIVYNKQKVILCDLEGNIDVPNGFKILNKNFKKASDGNYSPKSKNITINQLRV
jgi:hypothetical protein